MKRGIRNRVGTGLIAFAMVLAQVLMPVQSAFAAGPDKDSKSDEPKKVYVCKYVGTPGLNERIQTGQNPIEVSVNTIGKEWDGNLPGYFSDAHDRSYVLGYVTEAPAPSILDCPNVANPSISIQQTVICGPNNDMITATSSRGVIFTYSGWAGNSQTVTATLAAGYSWSDGTTAARQTIKTDAATVCPTEDKEITTPVPAFTDPCGLANASWKVQANTDEYTWSTNASGELTVTAKAGFYFTVNGMKQTAINFGVAKESGALCPTPKACTLIPTILSTDKDSNGWYIPTEAEYVDGGIKLNVNGEWDTTSISRTMVGPLADIGSVVDFSASPNQYVGIHIDTDKGTLTFEKEGSYEGKWWSESDFGVASGMGYKTFDTLENIVAANPGVMTSKLRVLYTHPLASNSIITSVTVGCAKYTFDKAVIVRQPTECTVSDNLFDAPWNYDEVTFPEVGGGGSYNFEPKGLYLNTPATESYVDGLMDAGMTPIMDVDNMSYDVLRLTKSAGYESTLPAYILLIDTKGDGKAEDMKYFFYEPYNNDAARAAVEGTFQSWDAIAGGNAKWWMQGTGQKLEKWSTFVERFPEAVVIAYGFNQGTYNAETFSAVQDITFDCATTSFKNKASGGNGGNGGDTPVTPTTPVVPVVPSQPVGGQGALPAELPMTGQNGSVLFTWIALLAAILTYGSVYYLQPKKRFEQ